MPDARFSFDDRPSPRGLLGHTSFAGQCARFVDVAPSRFDLGPFTGAWPDNRLQRTPSGAIQRRRR